MVNIDKEREAFEAWAKTQTDSWLIVGGLTWSPGTDDYASARTNAAWAAWQARAALDEQNACADDGKTRDARDYVRGPIVMDEQKADIGITTSDAQKAGPSPSFQELLELGKQVERSIDPMLEFIDVARALLSKYAAPAPKGEPVATVRRYGNNIRLERPDGEPFDVSEHVGRSFYAAPVNEQDAKDAQRYRWLLKQAWFQLAFDRFDPQDNGLQDRFEFECTRIIDAAIAQQGKGE